MDSSWLEIVSVFLMSSVKFVFGGVPLALLYGFSFFKTVTVTSIGGFTGSTFFVYTSDKLIAYFKKRKELKLRKQLNSYLLENENQNQKKIQDNDVSYPDLTSHLWLKNEQKVKEQTLEKPKKIFTRKNKIIVTVKKRFGLLGIALLTPSLFSIPIGCFLAVRYFKDKQRIVIYMFGSILFWSVFLSSFKLLF